MATCDPSLLRFTAHEAGHHLDRFAEHRIRKRRSEVLHLCRWLSLRERRKGRILELRAFKPLSGVMPRSPSLPDGPWLFHLTVGSSSVA